MPCKISAFVLQKSYLCSLSPTETPLNETLTPAGMLTSFPLHVSFHALLTPAGWRAHVKSMAKGAKCCCSQLSQWGSEKAMISTVYGMHRGQTASGCWPHSHQLPWQFAFLRCQMGEWNLLLDIIQHNNQIGNEFEALWAGLCSLGVCCGFLC